MRKQIVVAAVAAGLGFALGCPPIYAQAGLSPAARAAMQKPITVNFQQTDIQAAIRTLLQNTGIQYSVDSNVRAAVTIALTNQPLRDALKQVLSAGGYSYQIDPNSGVLQIGAKPEPPVAAPPPPDTTAPAPVVESDEATRDNRTWQFIPVNNTLPEFVMAQIQSRSGNIMALTDP